MTRTKSLWETLLNILFSILFGAFGFFIGTRLYDLYPIKSAPPNIFTVQINTLENVSKNLTILQKFIAEQKAQLIESEKTLTRLKNEEEKLKPVIEADRKTVEAILKMQSEIIDKNIWIERSVAFILGVLSSLFATFILSFLKNKIRS